MKLRYSSLFGHEPSKTLGFFFLFFGKLRMFLATM